METTVMSLIIKTLEEEIGREKILIEELTPQERQSMGDYHLGYVDGLKKILEDIKLLSQQRK